MKKLLLIFILLLSSTGLAQKSRRVVAIGAPNSALVGNSTQRVETYELNSKLLGRKTWFQVILPAKYGDKKENGRIYPTVYLLHGLAGHFENWTTKTRLIGYVAGQDWIVITPEGGDGWYTDSSTVPNDKYESYIIQELVPEIDHLFRTIADRRGRSIAGLSMGGYGAIKFGLKYPDMFSLVGSFSGALDAPLRGQNSEFLRPSIISVFGSEGSKTRNDNDIFHLLRESSGDVVKGLPYIYLACGTEDFLFQTNREFDSLLVEKKVAHEYRELPGAHTWDFWDAQVNEFLHLVGKR